MSARQFIQALDELRTMDPDALYDPFDPRAKVDYAPQLSNRSQTVTVQDLMRVVQEVAAHNQAAVHLVRVLGDVGFVVAIILTSGNYSGTTFPAISAIQSELTLAIRKDFPQAIVDLIDQDQISGANPSEFRRRGYFRVRVHDGTRAV